MSKLDQVVYVIKDGAIVEGKIRDFREYVDETTTPWGVGPRVHLRESATGGWEIWTWGPSGAGAHRLSGPFGTEAEAIEALEDYHAHDFFASEEILSFATRAEAEKALREC